MYPSARFTVAACAAQLSAYACQRRHCHAIFAQQCKALRNHAHRLRQYINLLALSRSQPQPLLPSFDEGTHPLLRCLVAIFAAVCLHLGTPEASNAFELASITEDKALEVIRVLESHFSSGLATLRAAMLPWGPLVAGNDTVAGRALIDEVYEVVNSNFMDARNSGFDPEKWRILRDRALAKRLVDESATHAAIREMVTALGDPYSRFITIEEFSSMVKYDVSGVGLNLGTIDELKAKTGLDPDGSSPAGSTPPPRDGGGVWVVGVMRGSVADVAGIRQGDRLLSMDGMVWDTQSPFEVATILQGPHEETAWGTSSNTRGDRDTIRLRIRRLDGQNEDVSMIRPMRSPTPSPVKYKLESSKDGDAVGYIKLTSFNARAQKDVAGAIQALERGGARRLVLDLRGNRGGLVTEGVEVARLFLNRGAVVVRTQGPRINAAMEYTRAPGTAVTEAQLAVLVDGRTASSAEIVAGALHDNCRGVLVGRRTYGKGLIQSVYELSDGSGLVLTVGKYLTPLGTDIDEFGITPDFGGMPSPIVAKEAIAACHIRTAGATRAF